MQREPCRYFWIHFDYLREKAVYEITKRIEEVILYKIFVFGFPYKTV